MTLLLQVYDQWLADPQIQQKLTQLAHAIIDQLGFNGSVTVTDKFITGTKLAQKMIGSSNCDKEKCDLLDSHSLILIITCACCYDEIKGNQDLKTCSHADSLSLRSHFVALMSLYTLRVLM